MRVLLHTGGEPSYETGIGNYLYSLGNELIQLGIEIEYLFGEDKFHKEQDYLAGINNKYRGIDLFIGANRFSNFIRNKHYDIVHSQAQFSYDSALARVLNPSLKYKLVTTVHGLEHPFYEIWKEEAKQGMDRFSSKGRLNLKKHIYMNVNQFKASYAHKHADRVIAVSDGVKKDIFKYLKIDSVSIANGVNPAFGVRLNSSRDILRNKYDLNPNDVVILFLGSSDWRKGLFYLLNAMKGLPPNIKLFVAGINKTEINNLNQSFELNSCHFLGECDKEMVAELLSLSDVFCLPSLYEGMSLALIEGMSAGLPCITTDINGVDELINNMENGIVVERRNTQQLHDAIYKVSNDKALRLKLGENAKETIKRFTWRQTAERTLMIYNGLINPQK